MILKTLNFIWFISKRLEPHSPTKYLDIMSKFYCRATENSITVTQLLSSEEPLFKHSK